MEGYTTAFLGMQFAFSGDWERGCDLSERSTQLNPHHPGWYWFPEAFDAYRKSDYRAALDAALKINMPRFWRAHLVLAMTYGQLGEREAARVALQQLLVLKPEFAVSAREELGKTWEAELVTQILEGLKKAGLRIAGEDGTANAERATGS